MYKMYKIQQMFNELNDVRWTTKRFGNIWRWNMVVHVNNKMQQIQHVRAFVQRNGPNKYKIRNKNNCNKLEIYIECIKPRDIVSLLLSFSLSLPFPSAGATVSHGWPAMPDTSVHCHAQTTWQVFNITVIIICCYHYGSVFKQLCNFRN